MRRVIMAVCCCGVLVAGCGSIRRSWADREPAWRVLGKYGELRQVELLFRPDLDPRAEQPGAVYVAGDFNHWTTPGGGGSGEVLMMQWDPVSRYWKLRLLLRKGVYRFVYLLNGREQVADMKSAETRADGSTVSRMVIY